MKPDDFEAVREMLKQESGLVLKDDKQYLLESRLAPVAKKMNYNNVSELVTAWRRSADRTIAVDIIEAMTINESFFFRDKTPFDNFENHMLPEILERNQNKRTLRIWSAAASTGQEAYSLAMILKEHREKLEGWKIEILGTDLSSEALEKAKAGLYSQFEVQRGMPVKYLVKNFEQHGTMWHIKPEIRSMASFRQFNLMKNFAIFGKFDIIFIRNVLIYFDKDTKADILKRAEKQTNPGCFLVLGASETLVGLNQTFEPVNGVRGLYQMNEHRGLSAMPAAATSKAGVAAG